MTAWGAPNYETLVLGRVLYGLAIGFGMHAAPAYISETVRRPSFANKLYPNCVVVGPAVVVQPLVVQACEGC